MAESSYRSDGTWSCTADDRRTPCGGCGGCREVQAENRAAPRAVMDLDPAAVEAAAKVLGLHPCGKWSTCSGGDNPTTRLDCSDDQCQNSEHKTRVPCTNRWHRLDAAMAIIARATADAIADVIEIKPTAIYVSAYEESIYDDARRNHAELARSFGRTPATGTTGSGHDGEH